MFTCTRWKRDAKRDQKSPTAVCQMIIPR